MQFKSRLSLRSSRTLLSSALLAAAVLGTAAPAVADPPTDFPVVTATGSTGTSVAPGFSDTFSILRGNGAREALTALGRQLATRFFRLLVRKDRPGLKEFLTRGWQIQRSDGSGATGRKAYLQELGSINVKRFRLSRFRVTRTGRVLIVRYRSQVTESINDSPLTQSEAPRLSTFLLHDGRWRMTSHANFAPLPR